jgi:membrane-bound metal-dependent hydrolase YbcI (DUF457 family)
MSSTLGHALCGVACLMAARTAVPGVFPAGARWIAAFAVLGNLPDFDFFAGYLWAGDFHRFHSGPSHSLLFALIAGALASLLAPAGRRLQALPWLVGAVASHDLVDLFGGPALGWHATYGVPLWWPFSELRVNSPLSLFFGIEHATLQSLVSWRNATVMLLETVVFAPPAALLWWWGQRRARSWRDSIETPR